jgi:hypothetical protein
MRIELTFPDQSRETADLKSGTGTSSVTSPIYSVIGNCKMVIDKWKSGIDNGICCTNYT